VHAALVNIRGFFKRHLEKNALVLLHFQKKKVQKLSLGLYLFKRYTFVPKDCILVPSWYILAPKMYILAPKMCILAPEMFILAPEMYKLAPQM